jgi:MFS family permease
MTGSFLGFCVGATLMGMGRASSDQSRYVAAEVHFIDRRAKVIGLIVFAGTIGAVLGPAIVAPSQAIAAGLGWAEDTGPFIVAALLYFLAMMVLMLFLRPDPKDISQTMEKEEEGTEQLAPPRPLSLIFQQPAPVLAVASISIGQLVMSLMMVITPLHMSHHDHSTQSISFVLSAHTLGMFALSGVTGWLIDRYGRVPLIVAGAFTLLAASVMAPQVTAVLPLAFALFLLGLGWNFTFIAGSSLLADSLAANERARTQGVTETFAAIAAASAGLVTGFLFDWAGMMAVGAVSLAFSLGLVGFFVYYAMSRVWVHQPKTSNQ